MHKKKDALLCRCFFKPIKWTKVKHDMNNENQYVNGLALCALGLLDDTVSLETWWSGHLPSSTFTLTLPDRDSSHEFPPKKQVIFSVKLLIYWKRLEGNYQRYGLTNRHGWFPHHWGMMGLCREGLRHTSSILWMSPSNWIEAVLAVFLSPNWTQFHHV